MADKTSCSSTRSHFILLVDKERGIGTYCLLITTVDTTTSNLMRHLQKKHFDNLVKAYIFLYIIISKYLGICPVTYSYNRLNNDIVVYNHNIIRLIDIILFYNLDVVHLKGAL